MTNLASKDGKLILRDGKLGTDCACCGGWYCDSVTCWSCQLTSLFPICRSFSVGDTAQAGVKVIFGGTQCAPVQLTASVSGFSPVAYETQPGAYDPGASGTSTICPFEVTGQSFIACNRSYDLLEVCGGAGTSTTVQPQDSLPNIGFPGHQPGDTPISFIGTVFSCNASFVLSNSCQPGFAALKVTADALQQWGYAFGTYSFGLSGTYTSDCVSIDGLPSVGSWLAGRSVSLSMTSSSQNGFPQCRLAPQTITIAFS